jgi:hypothetical protein
MPHLAKDAAPRPIANQKTTRNAVCEMRAAMALPRIRMAVRARPIMPANIGVKPSNSITTSAASGKIRYQLSLMARQGFGHWSLGMPSSFRRPASRCTMTNAVK